VVLFTRSAQFPEINRLLDQHFQQRTVQKTYYAHVAYPNRLEAEGEIRLPLDHDPRQRDRMVVVRSGGLWAKTLYTTEPPRDGFQPVWLFPETGRTHQLRVHLAALGAPILGDRLYGEQRSALRMMLHAYQIVVPEMEFSSELSFTAPIPWLP
jgi:23S rRNA-/tRNA-specific pseudouridylate synthase